MKKLYTILLLSLIIHSVVAQEGYLESTVSRNNAYAYKCYTLFNNSDDNLVISPFCISTCMAMAYIGSEGKTQDIIAKNMNFITPYGALVGFKELIKGYQTYKNDDINLLIGNALWSTTKIDLQKKYKNILKVNFDAHVENLEFTTNDENSSKTINRWAKKSSNYSVLSMIKAQNIDKDDKLIFTNYLSLNGNWENPFNEQFTSKDDFFELDSNKVKVDFMNQTSYLKYNENDVFQIVELPYLGNNLSMIILLPKQTSSIDSIEKMLNSFNFEFWTSELYVKLVNVTIPKFKIEFLQDVSTLLRENGSEIAFSNRADFSRIAKTHVYISKIFQKTSIIVEENKNNNFTEQIITPNQFNADKENSVLKFKANRPFLFFIKDNVNQSILLLGKVISPNFNNLSAEFYNN